MGENRSRLIRMEGEALIYLIYLPLQFWYCPVSPRGSDSAPSLCFNLQLLGRCQFINDKWLGEFRPQGCRKNKVFENEFESTLTLNELQMAESLANWVV